MLNKLLSILEGWVREDDLKTVAYDEETIRADDGEIIVQMQSFTIDTTYGKYLEFHSGDETFSLLRELFASQLSRQESKGAISLILHQAEPQDNK